jgi:hypothetical protein
MIDYLTLKNSYIGAIQMGLELGFSAPKQGNELLYEFCKKMRRQQQLQRTGQAEYET